MVALVVGVAVHSSFRKTVDLRKAIEMDEVHTTSATGPIEPEIVDVPTHHRFEARVGDTVAGFAEYRDHERDGAIVRDFPHTVVEAEYGGRGIAGKLTRTALDDARQRDMTVIPSCSFVDAFIRKHPEYADLVAS